MSILLPLSIVVAILLTYALWGREWLQQQEFAKGFFSWIEPIEIMLFKKSETILFGRLLQLLGAILTALTWLGSIDITPLMPLVPEKYAGVVQAGFSFLPLILNALGAIVERLRNKTTKPLELVAIPDKVVEENPVLAEAIVAAEIAKVEAVAVVETEKKAA